MTEIFIILVLITFALIGIGMELHGMNRQFREISLQFKFLRISIDKWIVQQEKEE